MQEVYTVKARVMFFTVNKGGLPQHPKNEAQYAPQIQLEDQTTYTARFTGNGHKMIRGIIYEVILNLSPTETTPGQVLPGSTFQILNEGACVGEGYILEHVQDTAEYWFWALWTPEGDASRAQRVSYILTGSSQLDYRMHNSPDTYYVHTEDGGGYNAKASDLRWLTIQVRKPS